MTAIEGGRPLRCKNCGEQIGEYFGDEPNWDLIDAQCFKCAATEEAEQITAEAARGDET